MKRLMKTTSSLLFAAAALLAIAFGSSLDDVRRSSVSLVDSLFPVPYHVEYTDAAAYSVSLSDAPVRFRGDIAVVSAPSGVLLLPAGEVRLTCADPTARLRNSQRAGFFAFAFCLLGAAAELGLLTLAVASLRAARPCRAVQRMRNRPHLPNAA